MLRQIRTALAAFALTFALLASAHATVRNVTTSSNLATVNALMVSGDQMLFAPGTYSITTAIELVSGTSYVGLPGAILKTTSSSDIFTMTTGSSNNIYISGLTFDGTGGAPDALIWMVDANGTGNITVENCIFQNTGQNSTPSIYGFQSDNLRFDNNIGYDIYQLVTLHNAAASTAHSNISISGNKVYYASRFAIEVQAGVGSPGAAYNNLNVNNNYIVDAQGLAISLVDNSNSSTGVVISGNQIIGGEGTIETANANTQIYGNTITAAIGGLLISHGPNTTIWGNNFRNVTTPLGQDGGYLATQWVGTNLVNGAIVTGWSGHPNDGTITPPNFTPQTISQILSDLADTGPDGRVSTQVMRNVIQSITPTGAILYPPTYP